ncbi:hypothetical protein LJC71_04230 [Desulfosarcina sp. OttesenSCG-928-A07]|nr:hypothetical protein [Desulfosarcina sp. OttesenSCG-928-G17]MDL2328947.1 hypothetical protein [Desulfosarcina sp. OttesenSCG-928-A07]
MTTIQPEGENLRKAVRWVAEEMLNQPAGNRKTLVAQACLKFNLTPVQSDFLFRNPEAAPGKIYDDP